ncbi:hypothetical protein VNO78_19643 [Psophocarpus tetragonolobus]|uniref:Uncharacterized protein n=1 Tax=Psophocarpus tetragonolobus TaxID=3891 RepID=A0AAN9S8Z8_PSOTE
MIAAHMGSFHSTQHLMMIPIGPATGTIPLIEGTNLFKAIASFAILVYRVIHRAYSNPTLALLDMNWLQNFPFSHLLQA